METKRPWEELYEKYSNGEMDNRYNELKSQTERPERTVKNQFQRYLNGDMDIKYDDTKTESDKQEARDMNPYEELKQMEKIKANLPKVKNVLDYRKKLEDAVKEIDEELKCREEEINEEKRIENRVKEAEGKIAKLEEKLEEKYKEIEKFKEKNKENKGTDEYNKEEEKLYEEYNELSMKNREAFKEREPEPKKFEHNSKLENVTLENLKKEKSILRENISKCNYAGKVLMEGKGIESIRIKMDKWEDRKIIDKDTKDVAEENEQKVNENDKNNEGYQDIDKIIDNNNDPVEDIKDTNEDKKIIEGETLALEKQDKFKEAFPRLARVFPNLGKNWLGKTLLKAKQVVSRDNKEENSKNAKVEQNESVNKQEIKNEIANEIENENKVVDENENENKLVYGKLLMFEIEKIAEKGYDELNKNRLKELQVASRKAAEEQAKSFKDERRKFAEGLKAKPVESKKETEQQDLQNQPEQQNTREYDRDDKGR